MKDLKKMNDLLQPAIESLEAVRSEIKGEVITPIIGEYYWFYPDDAQSIVYGKLLKYTLNDYFVYVNGVGLWFDNISKNCPI